MILIYNYTLTFDFIRPSPACVRANEWTGNSGGCDESYGGKIYDCVDDGGECEGGVEGVCGEEGAEVGSFEVVGCCLLGRSVKLGKKFMGSKEMYLISLD